MPSATMRYPSALRISPSRTPSAIRTAPKRSPYVVATLVIEFRSTIPSPPHFLVILGSLGSEGPPADPDRERFLRQEGRRHRRNPLRPPPRSIIPMCG